MEEAMNKVLQQLFHDETKAAFAVHYQQMMHIDPNV